MPTNTEKFVLIFASFLCAIAGIASNAKDENFTAQIPNWGPENQKELEDLLAERQEAFGKLIDVVSYRGDALKDYRLALRDLNLLMRENYADMIAKIGRNIYPVIVAADAEPEFAGVGTTYTLFLEDGTTKHISPTPPEYEMYKDLAHMALGLFTIVSPYFHQPTSAGWQEKMHKYHQLVLRNLDAARNSGYTVSPDLQKLCAKTPVTFDDHITMLSLVDEYIRDCFDNKSVDFNAYTIFTGKFMPYVQRTLNCASELQVNAAIPELQKWKTELGDKWRDLYVLIPVIWPVARLNPRQRIFETLMDEDRVKTHILKLEGAKDNDEARTTMGRIVGDRTLAQLAFGNSTAALLELNLALSTRRDLVASASNKAIENYIKEHGKPKTIL